MCGQGCRRYEKQGRGHEQDARDTITGTPARGTLTPVELKQAPQNDVEITQVPQSAIAFFLLVRKLGSR